MYPGPVPRKLQVQSSKSWGSIAEEKLLEVGEPTKKGLVPCSIGVRDQQWVDLLEKLVAFRASKRRNIRVFSATVPTSTRPAAQLSLSLGLSHAE